MPAGYIDFDERALSFGRLISMKEDVISQTGVDNIRYTAIQRDGKDIYRVGAIGKPQNVKAALDLHKDEAICRGSSVGK